LKRSGLLSYAFLQTWKHRDWQVESTDSIWSGVWKKFSGAIKLLGFSSRSKASHPASMLTVARIAVRKSPRLIILVFILMDLEGQVDTKCVYPGIRIVVVVRTELRIVVGIRTHLRIPSGVIREREQVCSGEIHPHVRDELFQRDVVTESQILETNVRAILDITCVDIFAASWKDYGI